MTASEETILGITVSVLSILYNFPLTWKVIKNKSARDIDLYFLMLRTVSTALYVVYDHESTQEEIQSKRPDTWKWFTRCGSGITEQE